MSFLWVGGRRVYFGWNLKHEVLCGCLNTPWHVVWEKGWARGGQSSVAAGSSLAQLLGTALEAPHQANIWLLRNPASVMSFTVKTVFGPSVGSILPFFMWAGSSGGRYLKFSALQPTHSKGQLGLWLDTLLLDRRYLSLFPGPGGVIQLPAHHAFLLAGSSRYWGSCVLLLPGPDPRKVAHGLPSGPLNHSAQLRD